MLRVGIVGFGYWGPILARNLRAHPRVRLAAVCDVDPARLAGVAAACPEASVSTNAADLVASPDLDALAIATPAASHFRLTLAALSQGKHVLVEKPLATCAADAERLVENAARRRLVLMTDHTFLFAPPVRRLAELVAEGSLGELQQYSAVRVALGRFRSDVDVLWDLAVHDVAVLDHLVGRMPASVSAAGVAHRGEQVDVAFLTLRFPDGLLASLHATWLAPVKIRRTLVGGSRRTALWDDLEPAERLRLFESGLAEGEAPADEDLQRRIGYRTGEVRAPRLEEREPLATMVAELVDAIEAGREPIAGPTSSLRVVRVVEAAERSARLGGVPVDPATGAPVVAHP
jgi:predicted dehydrogenase